MTDIKWKVSGKGLKRIWFYEGVKGTYEIHTQLLDGSNIYLVKIEHDNPYCIRFPIHSSLNNAKEEVEKYES